MQQEASFRDKAHTLLSKCLGIHKTKRALFFSPRPLGWNELMITFRMNEPFEMLRRLAWKKRSKALQHIKYERQRLLRGGCRPSPQWPSKTPQLLTPPYELVLEHGIQLWSSLLISLRHWEEIEVKGSQHLMLQKMISQDKGREGYLGELTRTLPRKIKQWWKPHSRMVWNWGSLSHKQVVWRGFCWNH